MTSVKPDKTRFYTILFAIILSLFFLGLALYLTITFNEISVHAKEETFENASGKSISYQVPSYAHKFEIGKFFADLSFSLATALIVFLFIEQALIHFDKKQEKRDRDENYKRTRELNDQINKNVFDGVLKNLIPAELFAVLATDVLQKNIIRQNAIWDVTFSENLTGTGFFLTFEHNYEFYNTGNNLIEFPLTLAATYSTISKTWYDYLKIQKKDGSVIFEQRPVTPIPTSTSNRFEFLRTIPLEAHETIKITTVLKTDYCSFQVIDAFWFAYSTVGVEMRIKIPVNTNFKLFPSFRRELNIDREYDNKFYYSKISAVLIGQSITFLIEKEPPKLLEESKV